MLDVTSGIEKKIVINMPQMAIEALSENWLFKELGDSHWEMICDGLNTKSFDLQNDTGNRLYATFVRIKFSCSNNLRSFRENQVATLNGNMKRFGESMYFSNIEFATPTASIQAELMTTFSIRDAVDNTQLAKSEPSVKINDVQQHKRFPAIGNEYRLVKKQVLKELTFEGIAFEILDEVIFETDYELNPFYDINGVNLLYFAAYPIINDVCEARFFNEQRSEEEGRWEQNYYTHYKDVLYYANCNVNDSLIYQLTTYETLGDELVKLGSILRRKSDNKIIARIFSIKKRN